MDRFIVFLKIQLQKPRQYLKSNMDRFIDTRSVYGQLAYPYLKSNMDRFIVNADDVVNLQKKI